MTTNGDLHRYSSLLAEWNTDRRLRVSSYKETWLLQSGFCALCLTVDRESGEVSYPEALVFKGSFPVAGWDYIVTSIKPQQSSFKRGHIFRCMLRLFGSSLSWKGVALSWPNQTREKAKKHRLLWTYIFIYLCCCLCLYLYRLLWAFNCLSCYEVLCFWIPLLLVSYGLLLRSNCGHIKWVRVWNECALASAQGVWNETHRLIIYLYSIKHSHTLEALKMAANVCSLTATVTSVIVIKPCFHIHRNP